MRLTTARQVRASLQRVFGDDLPDGAAELAAHPAAGLRAIATELREAHNRLIAPHWSRIRAVLDADIAYRAKQLAAGGAERLFADLHPDLHWHDGRLTLERWRSDRVANGTAPGGLVLLPVVLGTPYVLIKLHTTTQTTVRYPARGVGLDGGNPPSEWQRDSSARTAPSPTARSLTVTRDDYRPRPRHERVTERGVTTPQHPARQRPHRRRTERTQRAVPDHRTRPGSTRPEAR
jgi:hypothetical protein